MPDYPQHELQLSMAVDKMLDGDEFEGSLSVDMYSVMAYGTNIENNTFIAVPSPVICTFPLNLHLSQPMQSKIREMLKNLFCISLSRLLLESSLLWKKAVSLKLVSH